MLRKTSLHSDEQEQTFLVGEPGEQREFKLKKSLLSACSPVFSAMLSGPWIEAAKTGAPITLPEDDPAAFGTLVHILSDLKEEQYQDTTLPGVEDFWAVADLSDKYDQHAVVRPWVEHCIAADEERLLKPDILDALTIAWLIRSRKLWDPLWHEAVDHSIFSRVRRGEIQHRIGKMNWYEKSSIRRNGLPDVFLDELRTMVEDRREKIHGVVRTLAQGLLLGSIAPCQYSGRSSNEIQRAICQNSMIGAVVKQLARLGEHVFGPISEECESNAEPRTLEEYDRRMDEQAARWKLIDRDIPSLRATIDSLVDGVGYLHEEPANFPVMYGHQNCSPHEELRGRLGEFLKTLPCLSPSQVEHFKQHP